MSSLDHHLNQSFTPIAVKPKSPGTPASFFTWPIAFVLILFCTFVFTLIGCETPHRATSNTASGSASGSSASTSTNNNNPANPSTQSRLRPLAYANGQAIRVDDVLPALLEAQGSIVLSEHLLGMQVQTKLKKQQINLTANDIQQEEQALLQALDQDPNTAQRLLNQLKQTRGLGPNRYKQLLARNAGLRQLVRSTNQASVTQADVMSLYQQQYGPQVEIRILVAETASKAQDLRQQALKPDQDFARLAAEHSIDTSSTTGGLLSWLSPADPTYPVALRQAAADLEPGQISPVFAASGAFAFIKLEQKRDASSVPFETVETQLTQLATMQAEKRAMDGLARQLLAQIELVPLDTSVRDAWQLYRRQANFTDTAP